MKDKVIIDTSVWIDYLQNSSSIYADRIDEMLLHNTIYVPKVVLAELIQGAHSEKEIAVIQEFLDTFFIIEETEKTWVEAGKLSYSLRKKGKAIHLIDCYIAVIAKEQHCTIFTLDKHFKEIQKMSKKKLTLL